MVFSPIIPADWIIYIALVFSTLGIVATGWFVFFVEKGQDLPRGEKFLGILLRVIIAALLLGIALFFWLQMDLF